MHTNFLPHGGFKSLLNGAIEGSFQPHSSELAEILPWWIALGLYPAFSEAIHIGESSADAGGKGASFFKDAIQHTISLANGVRENIFQLSLKELPK